MDIWAYNWTIDLLPGQKYISLKEKHELKYCRSRDMQNMHNVITGCQMIDFDWVLWSNSKSKHVIWIYRWTHCTTGWEPAQIQTGREMSMEPCPNRQFRFIDHPDRQSGSGLVPTRTRTRSDGPDPLLTLVDAHFATGVSTIWNQSLWHSVSIIVLWQPFCAVQVRSALLLHRSLMMHINILLKIYFKVCTNCR